MSSISPGSIGALNLVGSFAGAQRNDAEADHAKAESAERKFQLDQRALSAHSLDDVAEAELSSDRDADGRQLYSEPEPQDETDQAAALQEDAANLVRSAGRPDALGERGRLLDLEA